MKTIKKSNFAYFILCVAFFVSSGCDKSNSDDETIDVVSSVKTESGFIIYPEKGKYGLNILADEFVEAQKTEKVRFDYSLRAELPEGNSSLKIVIKTKFPFFCLLCENEFIENPGICTECGGFPTQNNFISNSIIERSWGAYNHFIDYSWSVPVPGNSVYMITFTAIDSGKPDINVFIS